MVDDLLDNTKGLYTTKPYVETSFTSKLVATINFNKPVYDSYVVEAIGWEPPRASIPQARKIYCRLVAKTNTLVRDARFAELKELFDEKFTPAHDFTDFKKLDLLLWQYGSLTHGVVK